MPSIKRRRLDVLGTARHVWSLLVGSSTVAVQSVAGELLSDTVIIVNEEHESGHTKVSTAPKPKSFCRSTEWVALTDICIPFLRPSDAQSRSANQ